MSGKLKDKNLVVKSNALVESRSKLSLVEQKIVLSVVSMIEPEDKDFKPYIFKITEFMKLAGLTGNSAYERIREISKGIVENVMEIKNKDSVLQVAWFSSVHYRHNEGTVDIQVSPELKPYLLGLKREFTEYQLKNVMKLKSLYSIRIYELLKQYKSLGKRTFKIKDLKHILKIPKAKYTLYADFKKRVLLVAQRELLEKTDLNFEFEEIKNGRKIDKIKFIITNNGKYIDNLELPKTIDYDTNKKTQNIPKFILEILPDRYRINSIFKLINKYLSKGFDEEYIISNIIYTSNNSSNNFPAYLSQALENDYATADRELQEKQKKAEQERIAREEAEKKRKDEEYQALLKAVESLSEDEYNALHQASIDDFKSSPIPMIRRQADDEEIVKANMLALYQSQTKSK